MEEFIKKIEESITQDNFVKVTLSRGKGDIKNVYFRIVNLKKGPVLHLTYRKDTQDISKNYDIKMGLEEIATLLNGTFQQAILFTLKEDIHIRVNPHGKTKIKIHPPTFSSIPNRDHNKDKQRVIDSKQNFLQALGITNASGNIVPDMNAKFRQINKYIELLNPYIKELKTSTLNVIDMGSGKGYLTFALYNHLVENCKMKVTMKGIELRNNLVELCNNIALNCKMDGLNFEESSIDTYPLPSTDLLVALHACDTATDDAIYKGIKANAKLIVVSPCCHKQIRKEIHPTNALKQITNYGILKERQAELLTDTFRALLLEQNGYNTTIVEFIQSEHTSKNILIIANKRNSGMDSTIAKSNINELKQLYGIKNHYLEDLLLKKE